MKTYYDRPILKEPVWRWYIPAYFFTGGVAAGTSLLGFGARLTGDEAASRRYVAASLGATVVSTGLLVADLGRPERFLNMLRVAKVTSPMSVGSWVLSAFGAATGAAAVTRSRVPQAAAAALAPVLATYTAVLVSDTAVPPWHEARHELPFVFAGGALASAGSVGLLLDANPVAARRAVLVGAALEVCASRRMKSRLGPLAAPYKTSPWSKVAEAATAAGAVVIAVRRRSRVGALLVLAGAATERFAVFHAGVESSKDPQYAIASAIAGVPGE